MSHSLEDDLLRLSKLAYRRLEWSEGLVRDFHSLSKSEGGKADFPLLEKAYAWLFVPFTLWTIDFHALCTLLLERVKNGVELESSLRLLVNSLPPVPSARVQAVAAAHEHEVKRGDYEAQVKAGEKYRLLEEMLLKNDAFHEGWAAIKAEFDVLEYQDFRRVIRRRMVSERGFRHDWDFNWEDPAGRFQTVFDVFCQRWNLYGMEGDCPLLQKLTVNLTPHGTMVFIPSWWSLDSKRDLSWSEIKKLHKVRVTSKQGAKLSRNQLEQKAEAEKVAALDAEAKASGLKGDKRAEWVMTRLKWPNPDARRLRLLISRAKNYALPM